MIISLHRLRYSDLPEGVSIRVSRERDAETFEVIRTLDCYEIRNRTHFMRGSTMVRGMPELRARIATA